MSEAPQSEGNGHSRKALLAGLTGGVAAFVASALARPEQAQAGTDGDIVLGNNFNGNATNLPTSINFTGPVGASAFVIEDGAIIGTAKIEGSTSGDGEAGIRGYVNGTNCKCGVLGTGRLSAAGVRGENFAGNSNAAGNAVEGVSDGPAAAGVSGANQGGGYGTTGTTKSSSASAVWGDNQGSGQGVRGTSSGGDGVFGQGGNGVHGVGNGGTGGFFTSTGSDGVFGQGAATGVHGFCQGANGAGVLGVASSGAGVKGSTSFAATVGVIAENTGGGTGLKVTGRATFNRSGIATIAGTTGSPKNSVVVTVPGAALTGASMVLATIQGNPAGVYVQGVVKGTTSFTIFLNKAVTTNVKVGWFIIN